MSEAPFAALRDAAIPREPDRYYAAALAPRAVRADLVTLAAFAGELANIPAQVREPLAGEIRLQWWRDALGERGSEAAAGHPVAEAMRATIIRHALPADTIDAVIDSLTDPIHGERPADESALRRHLAAGEGGLFDLTARICGGDAVGASGLSASAGFAYGLSRTLADLPSKGAAPLAVPRSMLPPELAAAEVTDERNPQLAAAVAPLIDLARKELEEIRPQLAKMSRAKRLPYLPLAMVRPNLRALEKWLQRGGAPVDPMPIGRLLRITWAHASGRL